MKNMESVGMFAKTDINQTSYLKRSAKELQRKNFGKDTPEFPQ